jgi:hypothetical protein
MNMKNENEIEGGSCPECGTKAQLRTCDDCGETAWIIDCGHMSQPRPIAGGRSDGSEGHRTFCEDCAEIKNEHPIVINEEHLGSIATELQAREVVRILTERGYDVSYGVPTGYAENANQIPDSEWLDVLNIACNSKAGAAPAPAGPNPATDALRLQSVNAALLAERDGLQERLDESRECARSRLVEIDALRQVALAAQAERDRLKELVLATQRAADVCADERDRIRAALVAIESYIQLTHWEQKDSMLAGLMQQARAALAEGGRI